MRETTPTTGGNTDRTAGRATQRSGSLPDGAEASVGIEPERIKSQLHSTLVSGVRVSGSAAGERSGRDVRILEAAKQGKVDLLRALLREGVDINVVDENGRTPLHITTTERHVAATKILLENRSNVNARDVWGETPLQGAVNQMQGVFVALLVAKGADVNAADKHGRTALHSAAERSDKNAEAVLQFLLASGGHVNQRDREGKTVLHTASALGKQILLQRGADVNTPDSNGNTPLHDAVICAVRVGTYLGCNARDVEILLDHGANTEVKNARGEAPADVARIHYGLQKERKAMFERVTELLRGRGGQR